MPSESLATPQRYILHRRIARACGHPVCRAIKYILPHPPDHARHSYARYQRAVPRRPLSTWALSTSKSLFRSIDDGVAYTDLRHPPPPQRPRRPRPSQYTCLADTTQTFPLPPSTPTALAPPWPIRAFVKPLDTTSDRHSLASQDSLRSWVLVAQRRRLPRPSPSPLSSLRRGAHARRGYGERVDNRQAARGGGLCGWRLGRAARAGADAARAASDGGWEGAGMPGMTLQRYLSTPPTPVVADASVDVMHAGGVRAGDNEGEDRQRKHPRARMMLPEGGSYCRASQCRSCAMRRSIGPRADAWAAGVPAGVDGQGARQ
ncbi:hypothetical protein B0H10DRAFT_636265 [Mycena sp. CBHHK59/15]|nr:hypothetical protein B0H10DRAFT_636265 [Mycena sp. CBHHK59/15]